MARTNLTLGPPLQHRSEGVEILPLLCRTATETAAAAGLGDCVRFENADMLTHDLRAGLLLSAHGDAIYPAAALCVVMPLENCAPPFRPAPPHPRCSPRRPGPTLSLGWAGAQ